MPGWKQPVAIRWRRSRLEIFLVRGVSVGNCQLLKTQTFHAAKMVFLVTGKKRNKERREIILHYPRIRSVSANDIYVRCWSPVPVVISLQREITDRMLWCLLSIWEVQDEPLVLYQTRKVSFLLLILMFLYHLLLITLLFSTSISKCSLLFFLLRFNRA